jgi:hypothetical protein
MTKASDLFVAALEAEGVKHVFGIPGEENLDLRGLRAARRDADADGDRPEADPCRPPGAFPDRRRGRHAAPADQVHPPAGFGGRHPRPGARGPAHRHPRELRFSPGRSGVFPALGPEDIVCLDNGLYKLWFARNFRCRRPNTLLLDNSLAAMGAGLPSAMAACMVHPGRKVVAVCGDGGFMMNSQELETAVRLGMDLIDVPVDYSDDDRILHEDIPRVSAAVR